VLAPIGKEAQPPATRRPTRGGGGGKQKKRPQRFLPTLGSFVSSKLRRTANQVTAPQAAARPIQSKLRATDYRYCES
jgi:hypothetical protein